MNESEQQNIDELLNGLLDDELDERSRTEAKRLLSHDQRLAAKFEKLKRQKQLLNALPVEQAPEGLLDQIQAAMERKSLFEHLPAHDEHEAGARGLFVRRLLTCAAMIGLVAVLGTVIFNIVKPGPKPRIARIITGEVQQQLSVQTQTSEIRQAQPAISAPPVRLQFATSEPIAANAVINRAIYEKGLLDTASVQRAPARSVYQLACSRVHLLELVDELRQIWDKFEQTELVVPGEAFGTEVRIGNPDAQQMAEVLQSDETVRSQLAQEFALLNSVEKSLPAADLMLAVGLGDDNLPVAEKPVLTSGQKMPEETDAEIESEQKFDLIIVVTDSR